MGIIAYQAIPHAWRRILTSSSGYVQPTARAAMAVRLGELMLADPRLEEIEINPVLVRETGAVAVDALVRRA